MPKKGTTKKKSTKSKKSNKKSNKKQVQCPEGVYFLNWGFIKSNGKSVRWRAGTYKFLDDKTMVAALGYNKFSDKVVPIPKDTKKYKLNAFQRDRYCRDARPEPKLKGLNYIKWVDTTKKKHLRIKDVLKLKKGDKVKMLVMDRNLSDIVTNNKGNKLYTAKYFFRHNTAVYIHDHDLQGYIIWGFDKRNKHPFEFDIEYKKGNWYPLRDGKLPKEDPQGFASFSYDKPKPWTDFPKTTRIGWRGPMMVWDKVVKLKDVYWYEK